MIEEQLLAVVANSKEIGVPLAELHE
ncbi:Protein of unknown function [Bacillus cytotoxicus]|uniref:Uncharacterized protein n=1 Tax=Bacillus cytotoxicus TaxID=580165 RepID=A0AAX2CMA8_9BACI|nr:Protein of unknown function [Bacillus cytotoxicus]SCN42478.1 Protein of unknown function [Bacillus cytotoxicus]